MSGLLLGSLLMLGGFAAYIWTFQMLVSATRTMRAPRNYMQLCKLVGGKPLGLLLEFAMIIYLVGLILVYQIMSAEILNKFMVEIGVDASIVNNYWALAGQKIITALILYPICCIRSMSSLSYASLLSLISIGYTILLVIIECPFYFRQNYGRLKINYFILDINLFDAVSFIFFSFCPQFAFFNIYHELQRPCKRRIYKVFGIYIYIYIGNQQKWDNYWIDVYKHVHQWVLI